MFRVLITGAGGFTGRHMAAELAAHDHEPIGLFGRARESIPIEFHQGLVADLLDGDALERAVWVAKPDLVVHLAAVAYVAHGNAEAIYRTNLIGTRNLLEALSKLPVRPRMTLMASSANVYGNAHVQVLDESVPPSPANDYAVSKLAMEYAASLYADRLPMVIARPFNYTGTGQSEQFLIPKILNHVRRRSPFIELGNLDVSRDFSDVRVVVSAYRRLLECPDACGATLNVCSGQAHSLREVLDLAGEISGHRLEARVNPAFVRGNEVRVLRGSRARLESLIGPVLPIPLRDTLGWMLASDAAETAVPR